MVDLGSAMHGTEAAPSPWWRDCARPAPARPWLANKRETDSKGRAGLPSMGLGAGDMLLDALRWAPACRAFAAL